MNFRTDRQRVQGLGSAKEGTGHFWQQRVTAIALVPLALLFILPYARSLGADFATAQETYASPFNAIVAILFILTAFRHLQLGLQVVIEDYIQNHGTRTVCLLINTLLTTAFALAGVFAIAKVAFSA